jgi:hypothetical protein
MSNQSPVMKNGHGHNVCSSMLQQWARAEIQGWAAIVNGGVD